MEDIPCDIERMIRALSIHHMEVIGPTTANGKRFYNVNGHSLSEDELRTLSRKHLLTNWDILNYSRFRYATRTT
jgi:hypothetical protein